MSDDFQVAAWRLGSGREAQESLTPCLLFGVVIRTM